METPKHQIQEMPQSVNQLMVEFLTWVTTRRRTYDETMEAWQSHCPRQTIWEDAIIEGLVELQKDSDAHDPAVVLTPRGKSWLGQLDAR
jgi:hypothetical protein